MTIPMGVIGTVVSANSGSGGADPHWDSVILLANFANGPFNSTNIDASGQATSVSNTAGTYALSSASPISANHGQYLNKSSTASSNYKIDITDNTSWPGAFTIEFWMNVTGFNGAINNGIIIKSTTQTGANIPFQLYWNDSPVTNSMHWRVGFGASTFYDSIATVSKASMTGSWHHLALTRDSDGWIRFFVDGSMVHKSSTAQTGTVVGANEPVVIYNWSNVAANGWYGSIDDFRITRDVCRYDSDAGFTVPTEPFWYPGIDEV